MMGNYLLVIHLPTKSMINIGALGQLEFQEGFYIYVDQL